MICPECKNIIKNGEGTKTCPRCGTEHHKTCWEKRGGCGASDCFENPEVRKEAEIIGNKTIPEILSGLKEEKEKLMHKGICPQCGKSFDTTLNKCYFCGYDSSEIQEREPEQKNIKFEEEFRERLHKKSDFRTKQRIIFFSSLGIVVFLLGVLIYFSYIKADEYFKSERYSIDLLLKEWKQALENKDILTYKELLDRDYQFIDKNTKPVGYDERVKRISKMFETYKTISVKIKNIRIELDKENTGYANVTFHQITNLDKKEEKGIKTMRLFKAADTSSKWKIFREYSE